MEILAKQYKNNIFDLHNKAAISAILAEDEDALFEEIAYDDSPLALALLNHSCAHLLAEAILTLHPDAKFFVGPVVDEGFYYDFHTDDKIALDELPLIEEKMHEIARLDARMERYEISRAEALERYRHDALKLEVLSHIPDNEIISIYKQGIFEDLCRGPHVPHMGLLKHFKLTKLAGAYLGGDERNEMLTRIYGICFATKGALKDYLHRMEEAKKRDHRRLNEVLEFFTFDEEIGAGLPIWLPNGSRLRNNLETLLSKALSQRHYAPVRGPEILKSEAWKISGHYENYGENMYFTKIDDIEYGIKPMNCVGHVKVYKSAKRSYRELPLRFYEYGVVHRHELSGVLHGLLRVREFTQDDAHIFCRLDQLGSEIDAIIGFVESLMGAFDFSYEMEISTRPTKSIGDEETWEESTRALKAALTKRGIAFELDEGGGAFYGPKIDIKITDAIGRKWQCGTIQIDMNLPLRFNLEYTTQDNTSAQPVMIHRAILGSFERFIAILMEHYAGEFPLFIAPIKATLIALNEGAYLYARELQDRLLERSPAAYVEIDYKADSLKKRIFTAEKKKSPLIIVLGDKEVASHALPVRDRLKKENYTLDEEDFINMIDKTISEVSL